MVDLASVAALCGVSLLIGWPAFDAWRRRVTSREASAVATALQDYVASLLESETPLPIDAALHARVERLRDRVPEVVAFLLAHDLSRLSFDALAQAAQRLALRLRRRVAFERKMLARSASGLKRGAVAAALPPLLLLGLAAAGVTLPAAGLIALLALEALGGWLLWRVARVQL